MMIGDKRFKNGLVTLAIICCILPTSLYASETLTIIHTNDTHGNIIPVNREGGFAQIGGYVKSVAESEENVLVLDAGDTIIGTPIAMVTKGRCVIDLMNAIGYDAMALGNNEFYYGADHLETVREWANFPLLSANAKAKSDKRLLGDAAYMIKNVGGIKVGIFGLTTVGLGANLSLKNNDVVEFQLYFALSLKTWRWGRSFSMLTALPNNIILAKHIPSKTEFK